MYVDELRAEFARMEERKAFLEKELKKLPKGRLSGRKRKNGSALVWETRKKGERSRVTLSGEDWIVNELIRRELLEREYADLVRNTKLLGDAVARMRETARGEAAEKLVRRVRGIGIERIGKTIPDIVDARTLKHNCNQKNRKKVAKKC